MDGEASGPSTWPFFDTRIEQCRQLIARHHTQVRLGDAVDFGDLAVADHDLLLHFAWSTAVEALDEALEAQARAGMTACLALEPDRWPNWVRVMPVTMEQAGRVYSGATVDQACSVAVAGHLSAARRRESGGLLAIVASLWTGGEAAFWRTVGASLSAEIPGSWGVQNVEERYGQLHARHLRITRQGDCEPDGSRRSLPAREVADAVDWLQALGHAVRDVYRRA
jgi:hypothetical protein